MFAVSPKDREFPMPSTADILEAAGKLKAFRVATQKGVEAGRAGAGTGMSSRR
jgi:L-aminopeptidase/D-esterase-like protein